MTALGIDPGWHGAGVAYVSKAGDRWSLDEVRYYKHGVERWQNGLGLPPKVCAVERITPHSGKANGLVTLAEDAGRWVRFASEMAITTLGAVQRPMPSVWRRDVLKLSPRTSASQAEKAAIDALLKRPQSRRYPVEWPLEFSTYLFRGMPDKALGHIAEAVGIALWVGGYRA